MEVSSDIIVVGSLLDDDNGTDSGSVSVFRFSGTDSEQEQKLLPDDGASCDTFGIDLALSDDPLLIGA